MLQRRQMRLGEFLIFGFSLTEYRDIRVRVFPSAEEIIVGFAALLTVSLHGIGPREAEWRQRSKKFPLGPSAMTDELLKLGGSLSMLSCNRIGSRTMIKNHSVWVLRGRGEQIHRLNCISLLARDDRTNLRQTDLLYECVLRTKPIQVRCQRFSLRHCPSMP